MTRLFDTELSRHAVASLLIACALTLSAPSPAHASDDLRQAMDEAGQALDVVFSVALTEGERVWYHEALLRVHEEDAQNFWDNVKWLRDAKAHIEAQDRKLAYVNDEYREQHATAYHCGLEQNDEPDPKELLRILNAHNPVIFADCERSMVIRKSDLDAWFAAANFVAEQAGLAQLSSEEIAGITAHMRELPATWGAGPIRFSSNWSAIRHWWSHMPDDVRERNAAAIAAAVTTREAITPEVDRLIGKARHENRNLALCNSAKDLAVGQARLLQEQHNSVADVLDDPGPNGAYDIGSQMMGIAEPTLERLCGDIWE